MKKTFIIPLLLSTLPCFGQQIGLTLGTAVFVPSASVYFGETAPPKNVCGSLAFRLSDDVKLGLSAGYGFESSMVHMKAMDEYERQIRLCGFPLEMELQLSKPLVILSCIRPFMGLGFGYYQYKSRTTVRSAGNKSETEAEIKGPAQYFTFGLDYRMSRRISALIQFKKLGLSGIKMEWVDPSYCSGWSEIPNLHEVRTRIGGFVRNPWNYAQPASRARVLDSGEIAVDRVPLYPEPVIGETKIGTGFRTDFREVSLWQHKT